MQEKEERVFTAPRLLYSLLFAEIGTGGGDGTLEADKLANIQERKKQQGSPCNLNARILPAKARQC